MIIDAHDLEGIRFSNISGDISIKTHDKNEIEIFCRHEDNLDVQEVEGILNITYNKEEKETLKKNFIEKIFKRSFKLNLPINASFIDDKDSILIYQLLTTEIEIYVPHNIINYLYIDGNINISGESFTDYIRIYANGKNVINFEKLKNVYIDSQGKVECFLRNIYNICLYTNGSGFARINSKGMHSLKVKSKGEMQVDFVGTINDLQCDISGIGNIDIFGRVEKKTIKKKGICKISINN